MNFTEVVSSVLRGAASEVWRELYSMLYGLPPGEKKSRLFHYVSDMMAEGPVKDAWVADEVKRIVVGLYDELASGRSRPRSMVAVADSESPLDRAFRELGGGAAETRPRALSIQELYGESPVAAVKGGPALTIDQLYRGLGG